METAAQQHNQHSRRSARTDQEPVIHNRIGGVLKHTRRYAFHTQSRLAADVGVSRSTISRLLRGKVRPRFSLIFSITRALEKEIGRPLDPRELISLDGRYPTSSVCALCGCPGCLPDEAYDENGQVRAEWRHIRPGRWSSLSPGPPADKATPSNPPG